MSEPEIPEAVLQLASRVADTALLSFRGKALVHMYRTNRVLAFLAWPVDVAILYFLWSVFGTPWWWWGLIAFMILGSIGGGIFSYRLEKETARVLGVKL